jgi:hypothetical protein
VRREKLQAASASELNKVVLLALISGRQARSKIVPAGFFLERMERRLPDLFSARCARLKISLARGFSERVEKRTATPLSP